MLTILQILSYIEIDYNRCFLFDAYVLSNLNQSDEIGIFNINTRIYTPLLISKGDIIFLDWLNDSHILVKISKNNQERVALYNFKTQKVLYLFSNDNVHSAISTGIGILGLKLADPQDPFKWDVLISSPKSPYKVRTLFTIPFRSDCAQITGKEEKFVFFSDLYPISESEVFYRVLESETHQPLFCGIANLNTGGIVEVDNKITSIRKI